MTLVQAKAVASAIIDAGFNAVLTHKADGSWTVRANSNLFNILVTDAAGLATAQGVTGKISEIEYS